MNDLENFRQRVMELGAENSENRVCGLCAFLVTPDGNVIEYARLVDENILATGSVKVLRFFGDDLMYSFHTHLKAKLRALPDRQAESCEDGGLKQETDVNADLTESLDSGSDAAEDLWVSEGGSQASHNYDVEDAND